MVFRFRIIFSRIHLLILLVPLCLALISCRPPRPEVDKPTAATGPAKSFETDHVSGLGRPQVTLRNDISDTVKVRLVSVTKIVTVNLPQGAKKTITIPPGAYSYTATRGGSAHETGQKTFKADHRYTWYASSFRFNQSGPAPTPPPPPSPPSALPRPPAAPSKPAPAMPQGGRDQGPFQSTYQPGLNQPVIQLRNTADRTITVSLAGPVKRTVSLKPGRYQTLTLPPGRYYYQASARNTNPKGGTSSFQRDHKYTWTFYIR